MSKNYPTADWSRLRDEPDLEVPLLAGAFIMISHGKSADEKARHCLVTPANWTLGELKSRSATGRPCR